LLCPLENVTVSAYIDTNFFSMYNRQYFHSPIGILLVEASEKSLQCISFVEDENEPGSPNDITRFVVAQLEAYFSHLAYQDIFKFINKGSSFQRSVWQEACRIPVGKTMTYQQIALNLGDIKQTRAVARALATNPFLVLIPCHRVLGKDGKLRGYAGSASRKQWLLGFESGEVEQLSLFTY
jgi:methylated-DNA-[protein]-cysteine S-methyltransferase